MENNNLHRNGFQKPWSRDYKKEGGPKPPHAPQTMSPQSELYGRRAESAKSALSEHNMGGTKIKSFKELIVWQKGLVLVKEIYAATATFPREEMYGLVSQLRRSAVSVPSNIAEGFRRRFQKELKQFLNIALGSLAEIETQIAIAGELGYIKTGTQERLNDLTDQVTRLAVGLSKKI